MLRFSKGKTFEKFNKHKEVSSIMKDKCTIVLKEIFSTYTKFTRKQVLDLSQEEMAAKLLISQNNYSNLETKKTCCSGLTLALYLTLYCEDPFAFIMELKEAFRKVFRNEDNIR